VELPGLTGWRSGRGRGRERGSLVILQAVMRVGRRGERGEKRGVSGRPASNGEAGEGEGGGEGKLTAVLNGEGLWPGRGERRKEQKGRRRTRRERGGWVRGRGEK